MTVTGMREVLIKRYSPVIRNQRVDCMPDRQVVAIYRSLIDRRDPLMKCGPGIPKKSRLHDPVRFEQLEMDLSFHEEHRHEYDQTS